MSKEQDYYDLVNALFQYHNNKDLEQLLDETIIEVMKKGYDPLFCAMWLHGTLRDEAALLRPFEE